jgi:hypothetical protein
MSSQRRIQSSQANGARSRGPVTTAGKLAIAAHQQRHGMLAQTVVLTGESEERFLALLSSFVAQYNPRNEAEHALVENLCVARWRQLRTWSIQKSDFDREMAKSTGPAVHRAAVAFRNLADNSRSMDLVQRYEAGYDRQFLRALKVLETTQAKRSGDDGFDYPISIATATFQEEAPCEHEISAEPSPINGQLS